MRQSREERERGEGKGRKRGKRKEKGGKKVEGFRRCLIGQKGLKGTREERAHYWRGRSIFIRIARLSSLKWRSVKCPSSEVTFGLRITSPVPCEVQGSSYPLESTHLLGFCVLPVFPSSYLIHYSEEREDKNANVKFASL